MHVLFICNEYPPRPNAAGIGTAVQTIARSLSRRGHRVTVVGLGDADEAHLDGQIRVVTLKQNHLKFLGNLISRVQLWRWICAFVNAEKVDVVETPDSKGLLPFKVKGSVVVVRLHLSFTAVGVVTGEKTGWATSLYERLTLKRNSNWIAVSNHVLDLTQKAFGIVPRRSVTVYNPVTPPLSRLSKPAKLPERYVLYAGHVCRRKGADVLAEAAREIMKQTPDLHLVYAGGIFREDGRQMCEIIREMLGPEVNDRVHFLGRITHDEVLACMAHSAVFAFPSHVEGFPMVILEAMSCGVPVVFSRTPPGPEILEDGVSGLLAETNARDFREKISRILANTGFAASLGANARRSIEQNFTTEECGKQTERFYKICLGLESSEENVHKRTAGINQPEAVR